ncbi:hypothetical protein GP913_24265 [Enterobacteriaceae bacterium 8376wG6]|nr:hypothetical protein [Enterobacteriaceae bacterium 8376wG6]
MGYKIRRSHSLMEAIGDDSLASLPIDEFEQYKAICLDEGAIPAPSSTDQMEYVSYIDTIGRDKFMTHPIDARAEELHHTHVWQEGCRWGEGDDLRVQWMCTSNSYVVYSYFIDSDDEHHIYIIDYCKDQAHALIEDPETVKMWSSLAKTYRAANS